MNISMDLLQTFVIYVETENVVKTAQLLGISQPAVSAHLKRLQEHLPVPALITKGRRKELTEYGRALYSAMQNGMKEINRGIERTNQRYIAPEQLSLRIGVRNELLPRIAQMIGFPGTLIFSSSSTKQSTEDLLDNKIDVAITTATIDSPHLIAKTLFSEGVKLICHKKFLKKSTELKNFAVDRLAETIPILSYREDAPFLKEWCSWCGITQAQLRIAVQCENWSAIAALVTAGRGYSVVPENIPIDLSEVSEFAITKKIVAETKIFALYRKDFAKIPPLSHLTIQSK